MPVSQSAYADHKNSSAGDIVQITCKDGTVYTGTVFKTVGATVYIQSDGMQVLETQRVEDDGFHIVLSIGNKEVVDESRKVGYNKHGKKIQTESITFSHDTEVSDFVVTDDSLTLG